MYRSVLCEYTVIFSFFFLCEKEINEYAQTTTTTTTKSSNITVRYYIVVNPKTV